MTVDHYKGVCIEVIGSIGSYAVYLDGELMTANVRTPTGGSFARKVTYRTSEAALAGARRRVRERAVY